MDRTPDIEVNGVGAEVPGDTFISVRDGTANDVQDMKRMGKQQQLQVSEQSNGLIGQHVVHSMACPYSDRLLMRPSCCNIA